MGAGTATNQLAAAIGTAIRHAMTDAGLTQAQFAERSGLNIKTVSRRLSGSIPFTYPEIRVAADITGVSVAELIEDAERAFARKTAS